MKHEMNRALEAKKKLFITLFLIGMSMVVCSQDYYWYKGTKVPLVRGCRQYIIYEDDKLSESDKSQITHSEDVFYDEIPNLKWGKTKAHAVIKDTAHVHYSTISYRKGGDYYDNLFITHRFYVKLKNQEDLPLLEELAAQNSAEIESEAALPAWYILRCKLDAPKNALELANLFYETTDLFVATEPEMIYIIAREFPKAIKSLCDEWNVLHEGFSCIGPYCNLQTDIYRLTTDTLIRNVHYVKLMSEEGSSTIYKGALREGSNRDIYYVPENSTNEYLIYAFNAQVGDELQNVWLGGEWEKDYCINAHNATVIAISDSSPRIFTLEVIPTTSYEDIEMYPYRMNWIEGVGMSDGPVGSYDSNKLCTAAADMGVYTLLCAYMEGEQVYTSEMGQKYGCYYDGGTQQAMFPSDTRWDYVHTEMYGGPDYKPTYFSVGLVDTLINHIRYQQISDALFRSTLGANDLLFRSKGAKVWCLLDSMEIPVERLVYDFDLQIGDSIRKWGTEDYLDPTPKYAKVTKVEKITLPDGRSARRLSYDDRPDDIEHIGSVDGIFAPLNLPTSMCGCGEHFLCCTRGDILLYEVAEGACDTFFVDNRPYADTIPLFIKDGPGSSTVEPVDPNQIVAVLQMDVLSIFEHIGKEIGYKLTQTSSSSNTPANKRLVKSDTFQESVAVTLTESGTYMLELTHPDWNYTIVGTFEYMGGENAVINTEVTVPSARKILRDGQLLIRKGDKIYTLTGVQIQ